MAQSLYARKAPKPLPPDKGSFPLDHEGDCKKNMEIYMECLRSNKFDNSQCRLVAKDYLDCRMQKELMAKTKWSKLGYGDLVQDDGSPIPPSDSKTT